MSDVDARSVPVVMEKSVLIDFLQLYKSFPCLWDQKHMLYGNREARVKAYEVLLNKYKLIHEGAEVKDVKKKLEYMRCAYRREHKKVIMAKLRGEKYIPILYYYDRLKFLNDNEFKTSNVTQINSSSQETHEIEDSDDETIKPKRLKMLLSMSESECKNEDFLAEYRNNRDDESANEEQSESENEQEPEEREPSEPYVISTEPESFGRTVGFQLKELPHIQRVYAEKLISDVIFQARLGNLTADTSIHDDSD